MNLLAYLAEAVVVHLIDWLIGGVAGFLIGRGGRGRIFGILFAIVYVMAIAGSFMGGPPNYFGPAAAIVAFTIMLWIGLRHARMVSTKSEPSLPTSD